MRTGLSLVPFTAPPAGGLDLLAAWPVLAGMLEGGDRWWPVAEPRPTVSSSTQRLGPCPGPSKGPYREKRTGPLPAGD